jgi:hypothetical protein
MTQNSESKATPNSRIFLGLVGAVLGIAVITIGFYEWSQPSTSVATPSAEFKQKAIFAYELMNISGTTVHEADIAIAQAKAAAINRQDEQLAADLTFLESERQYDDDASAYICDQEITKALGMSARV